MTKSINKDIPEKNKQRVPVLGEAKIQLKLLRSDDIADVLGIRKTTYLSELES